jgi:hypothetical protein
MPHYVLPYLAPLLVFAGITFGATLQGLRKVPRWGLAGATILLLVAGTYRFVHEHLPSTSSRASQIINSANYHPLDGKILLAPQADISILHYYFPHAKLVLYLDEKDKQRLLAEGQSFDAILSDENEPLHIDYGNQPAN